jgi:hypothetical protein
MTILNKNTEKAKGMICRYNAARRSSIYEAYGKPSIAKIRAFNSIHKEMENCNGRNMKITGAGSSQFSCAYVITEDNTNFLIYHTSSNVFKIAM